MKKRLPSMLLIGVLSILFVGCTCNSITFPFLVFVKNASQSPFVQPLVISKPTKIIISTNDSYSASGACRSPMLAVQKVTFFKEGFKIGETSSKPFELEYTITPGQDGIPTSGFATLTITAQTETGVISNIYSVKIDVQP